MLHASNLQKLLESVAMDGEHEQAAGPMSPVVCWQGEGLEACCV